MSQLPIYRFPQHGPRPMAAEPTEASRRTKLVKEYRGFLRARGYSGHTQWNYSAPVRRLFVMYPQIPLEDLRANHVEHYLSTRPSSAQYQEFVGLRTCFAWLNDADRLSGNPCMGVPSPAQNRVRSPNAIARRPRTVSRSESASPAIGLAERPTEEDNRQHVLGEFGERLRRLNYARTTQRNYAATVRRFLKFWPEVPLERVTPEHVERYLYSRPLAPRSVWTELETLRAFFTWCVRQQRLLKVHPCEGIERPRWRLRPRPAPTSADFEAVRRGCQSVEEATLLELLYFAGLRHGELRLIRVRDLDLARRRIRVLGKGAKERIAVFSARVGTLLQSFLTDRTGSLDDWLFPSPVNQGFARSRDWINAVLKRLGREAGLPYTLTAHILRHGFFRLLKTRGVPVEVAARLGGHSKIQTTVEIYGRMDDDDLQQAYDRHVVNLGG